VRPAATPRKASARRIGFGLSAALIVLLAVFGAVVAALVPMLLAIVSIVVALAAVAVLAHAFVLSVFAVLTA
jgi:RND superfamily putative drug exporter